MAARFELRLTHRLELAGMTQPVTLVRCLAPVDQDLDLTPERASDPDAVASRLRHGHRYIDRSGVEGRNLAALVLGPASWHGSSVERANHGTRTLDGCEHTVRPGEAAQTQHVTALGRG